MTIHDFHADLWLPRSVAKIFGFFADAYNLQTLTPEWVNFEILTPKPIRLRAGALIDCRLRIHGLPVRWQTEITTWEPAHRFVDEQKRGPYRLWIHEPHFPPQNGGPPCPNHARYAVLTAHSSTNCSSGVTWKRALRSAASWRKGLGVAAPRENHEASGRCTIPPQVCWTLMPAFCSPHCCGAPSASATGFTARNSAR